MGKFSENDLAGLKYRFVPDREAVTGGPTLERTICETLDTLAGHR